MSQHSVNAVTLHLWQVPPSIDARVPTQGFPHQQTSILLVQALPHTASTRASGENPPQTWCKQRPRKMAKSKVFVFRHFHRALSLVCVMLCHPFLFPQACTARRASFPCECHNTSIALHTEKHAQTCAKTQPWLFSLTFNAPCALGMCCHALLAGRKTVYPLPSLISMHKHPKLNRQQRRKNDANMPNISHEKRQCPSFVFSVTFTTPDFMLAAPPRLFRRAENSLRDVCFHFLALVVRLSRNTDEEKTIPKLTKTRHHEILAKSKKTGFLDPLSALFM